MKVNNLYAKPIMKAVFYILLLLGVVNVGILLTQMQPLSDLAHISIGVSFFVMAGLVMSKNIFIKYNSEDAVIEIERAGLFSSNRAVHSGQLGFVKTKVQGYEVRKTWYGSSFTLVYSTSKGRTYSKKFPIFFGSAEDAISMDEDLSEITKSKAVQTAMHQVDSKVLKNSPAFS